MALLNHASNWFEVDNAKEMQNKINILLKKLARKYDV